MKLNTNKYNFITFSLKKLIIKNQYQLINGILIQEQIVKDLGIWFQSKLTINHNIYCIQNKTLTNLGFIKCYCKSFNDNLGYGTIM